MRVYSINYNPYIISKSVKITPHACLETVKLLMHVPGRRGSATCFAFGQTGAGKTYTLMGNKNVPGLYQLAGRDILDTVHSAGHRDNDLHLWISYYEIYCGQLFDLLNKRKRSVF